MKTIFCALILTLGIAHTANAADKFDTWINVFSEPGFDVRDMKPENSTSSSGRNEIQVVDIRANGQGIQLVIQRAGASAFSRDGVDRNTRSLKNLARFYRSIDGPGTNFQKVRGSKTRGASFDFRSGQCRAALVGIRGSHPLTYDYVVEGQTCGSPATLDLMSNYLARMKPAKPQENVSAAAYHGTPTRSQRTEAPTRSPVRAKCDAAGSDTTKQAAFMQELSRSDVVKYLDSGLSCEVF